MQGQVPLLPATQGCAAGHGIFQVLAAGKHLNGSTGKGSSEKYCIREGAILRSVTSLRKPIHFQVLL